MKTTSRRTIVAMVWACLILPAKASPGARRIDGDHSSIHVHVHKSGLFSAFGHDHDIEATIESGEMTEAGAASVEIRVDARKLHVLDQDDSADTRAEVQKTML